MSCWPHTSNMSPVIGTQPAPMLDDYAAGSPRIRSGCWRMADAIAGVLVLENGPDCFLLDNIAVRPDRQGSGFGRQLLDFAEAEAMRCGWDTHHALYQCADGREHRDLRGTRLRRARPSDRKGIRPGLYGEDDCVHGLNVARCRVRLAHKRCPA